MSYTTGWTNGYAGTRNDLIGDRVRDKKDGALGTVTAANRVGRNNDYWIRATIVWDDGLERCWTTTTDEFEFVI